MHANGLDWTTLPQKTSFAPNLKAHLVLQNLRTEPDWQKLELSSETAPQLQTPADGHSSP